MKVDKKFIRVGLFLLLSCIVSATVLGRFDQRFMKIGNLSNKPSIVVLQGDITKNIIQRDLLAPSGALALVAIQEPTEVIEIGVDNYLTTLTGFSAWEPEVAFRLNADNGFQTVEVEGNGLRYPITSKCVPLINSSQMLNVIPIFPAEITITNRTSDGIALRQKSATGALMGGYLVAPNSSRSIVVTRSVTKYLEFTVSGATLKLFSFKYNDPEITFEKVSDGIVFNDGTYRYFVTGKSAPKITAP